MTQLPIVPALPRLQEALRRGRAVILSAPTGSGKTTGAPLALLDEDWLAGRRIVILEPRRLAARMAAARMAEMINEPVGMRVGYTVRLESLTSAATRIEVVTEGILTRRLQDDPSLSGVGLVIFDEFHERGLSADLGLALCLEVMDGLRDDLKVMVMSATLDIEGLTTLLDQPEVVIGAGQSFPVRVEYLPPAPGNNRHPAGEYSPFRLVATTQHAIRLALRQETGNILVFMPGAEEIRRLAVALAEAPEAAGTEILPLYGDLPRASQERAINPTPGGRRRVILATAIAETSLTIEGVRVVIDPGFSRRTSFDPNSGLSRLVTVRVSRAAARQRRGRAGRLEPGVCYRLWPETDNQALAAQPRPEILDADLAPLALELANWGTPPDRLHLLDPPPAGHYAAARDLLLLLGALDRQGKITRLGQRLARLPVHPRLGRMLIAAGEEGGAEMACEAAALLSERDVLRHREGELAGVDLELRRRALAHFQRRERTELARLGGDPAACQRVNDVARQLKQLLKLKPRQHRGEAPSLGGLLALAYPDRVGQLRPGGHHRYRLANGRGANLPETDPLLGTPYLVAPHLDAGQVEGRIHLAVPVSLPELRARLAALLVTESFTRWDEAQEAVASVRRECLLKLILEERPLADPDPEAVRAALIEGLKRLGIAALPWGKESQLLQARVESLRRWQPEDGWPDLSDQTLSEDYGWLAPYLDGMSRRTHLARLDLTAILRARLDWRRLARLENEAPTHFSAPSGSRLPLLYQPGQPPVLSVRLQELFGLAETPKVAKGQVPVTLHLLSPAQRPIQVTQDLAGFWNSTYQEVKKELKGRYPKHHWPDDPWSAPATARAKPRR